jgi:shikimate dehydrogenase
VPYLDELTPEASFLQAVNTIQNQNGKLIGHNTDVEGFLFLLANNNLIKNQNIYPGGKICLLGAGGAARAACLALSRAGAEHIVIYNRTPARAEALASLLVKGGLFKEKAVDVVKWGKNALRESLTRVDMIINALSVDPVELGLLPERTGKPVCKAAIDLRYGSLPRSFIKWADDNGMLFFDGLDMLLGQGLKAFEILTGEKAPLQTMRKALLQAVV